MSDRFRCPCGGRIAFSVGTPPRPPPETHCSTHGWCGHSALDRTNDTWSTGPSRPYVRSAEDRVKSNEVVISRSDIFVMALYRRATTVDDTIVVLVREFRSPASTPDGLVHELPGGSAAARASALDQAIQETQEETGLAIDAQRIRPTAAVSSQLPFPPITPTCSRPRSPTTNSLGYALPSRRRTALAAPSRPG